MKFLFASDSFKGTLTSGQTIELLAKAAKEVFGEIEYSGVPVADGGEGTTDAVVAAEGGRWIECEVCGQVSFTGDFMTDTSSGDEIKKLKKAMTGAIFPAGEPYKKAV